jgi:hypothetical protein
MHQDYLKYEKDLDIFKFTVLVCSPEYESKNLAEEKVSLTIKSLREQGLSLYHFERESFPKWLKEEDPTQRTILLEEKKDAIRSAKNYPKLYDIDNRGLIIEEVFYFSIREAAEVLGESKSSIQTKLSKPNSGYRKATPDELYNGVSLYNLKRSDSISGENNQ